MNESGQARDEAQHPDSCRSLPRKGVGVMSGFAAKHPGPCPANATCGATGASRVGLRAWPKRTGCRRILSVESFKNPSAPRSTLSQTCASRFEHTQDS
jgi:hypothetical protein